MELNIDIVVIPFAFVIHIMFLFRREWLTDKELEKWIFAISLILFVIGYFLGLRYGATMRMLPLLMLPLLTYILYRLELWIYVSLFKTAPVDTYMSADIREMKSGIFNFIFWVTGMVIPTVLAYELVK